MRKILLSIAATLPLLVGACTPPTTAQIQQATTQLCGFVPTAVVITSFIPQVAPFGATAGEIATAICTALQQQTNLGTKRRLAGNVSLVVNVHGATVQVSGHYK